MIEINSLTKRFGKTSVLEGISMTIPTGSTFGLLGSNGAGKSTILRLISGIYRQDGGELLIDGKPAFDNVPAKERIFFINDETVQFAGYTLTELKNFYKQFYPKFSEEVFARLQQKINLPLKRKLNTFSKGMKRQAVMITALACQTDYLLLDEAFDGLDPTMRIIVKHMLVDAMMDRGMTTIISSHNLNEINEVCDTAALLHGGKIIFSRELDSVRNGIHKLQVVFPQVDGAPPELAAADLSTRGLDVLHFDRNQSIFYVIVRGEETDIRASLAPMHPVVLDILPLSLEEIFLYELEVLGYDSNAITE